MCNERKLDKRTSSKLKTFVCQDNSKNDGKKFSNYVSDKGLVFRIYSELSNLNNKKGKLSLKK